MEVDEVEHRPVGGPVDGVAEGAADDQAERVVEAIAAAAGALSDPAKQPWIITEEGEILSPNWIRTYLN